MSGRFAVRLGGAELRGEQAGEGQPVVLLHAGVADRRMWRGLVDALGPGWPSVAYDRRGFGETRSPDEPFSQVGDLRAVLDALGIGRAVLVGASQGGRVAIDFALAHAERVAALVLIAPAVSGAPQLAALGPRARERLAALEAAERNGDLERVNALEAALWLDGPESDEGRVGGELRALFLDMNGIALRAPALTNEIEAPPAWERLSSISRPSLVLWGALDFPNVRTRAAAVAKHLPDAEACELPGLAHLPSLEAPAEVARRIDAFLARIPR